MSERMFCPRWLRASARPMPARAETAGQGLEPRTPRPERGELPITPPRNSDATQSIGAEPEASARSARPDGRRTATREHVRHGIESGLRLSEIADSLGVSRSTVCYHARRLGFPARRPEAIRHDWPAIQAYHDAGHTQIECRRKFGFSHEHWVAAIGRGELEPRLRRIPIEDLLVDGRPWRFTT